MPIYEFRCMTCNACMELLVMGSDENVEMQCRECKGHELERIMSRTTHNIRGGGCSSGENQFGSQTRSCSSGSCTTYNLPGPD